MSKQQTAVEFLMKEISAILGPIKTEPMQDLLMKDAYYKALAMEKEQSEKMYNHATLANLDTGHGQSFEEYYNKTYKQD